MVVRKEGCYENKYHVSYFGSFHGSNDLQYTSCQLGTREFGAR